MAIARHFSAVRSKAFIGAMGFTVFFAMVPHPAAQTTLPPTDELRADIDSASLPDAPAPTATVLSANNLPSPAVASLDTDLEQPAGQSVLIAHPQNPQQAPQQPPRVPLRRSKISASLRTRRSLIQMRRPDWIAEHIC